MNETVWLLPGLRTPFAKAGGALARYDAIELAVPVVRAMIERLAGAKPDFACWGTVLPSLAWSNIAREVLLDAKVDPTIPAFSTVMACSTSMIGAIEAASMLEGTHRSLALAGGSESLSTAQVTSLTNRSTGKSMGEHMEFTVNAMGTIPRDEQDRCALASHRAAVAAWDRGFFDDLVVPFGGVMRDAIPRSDTSLEKLARLEPAFDPHNGTITAGNASPLTDGAAGLWVASDAGLARLPKDLPRAKLVDWELAAIDIWNEGLLMAPAHAIPRLLARHDLRYDDVALWEIHEAFAAQVLAHIAVLERHREFGPFPRERVNPNGGTLALGHPFGATGARILSQAVKELAQFPAHERAIVSICADGGQGTVALLEAP